MASSMVFRTTISKIFVCLTCALYLSIRIAATAEDVEIPEDFFQSAHTNNWAVLVDTSKFWFNYRHVANVLSIYRSVKRLGIPDSHIILMVADDAACNPRNPRPATVYNNKREHINVYGDDIEVDYRGYEVTVENFIRVITGRLPPSTPRSKRLLSDQRSNVLVYMTGHGGEGFLKFQDAEEISNVELADAFEQMWQKRRYNEILYIIDTCQAESMYLPFYSPNIIGVASSKIGEDSLSHHVDPALGVYIIDRYTYYVLEFLERVQPDSKKTIQEFLKVCPKSQCISTVNHRTDLFRRPIDKVLVTDFFGSVRNVETIDMYVNLDNISLQQGTCRNHGSLCPLFRYRSSNKKDTGLISAKFSPGGNGSSSDRESGKSCEEAVKNPEVRKVPGKEKARYAEQFPAQLYLTSS